MEIVCISKELGNFFYVIPFYNPPINFRERSLDETQITWYKIWRWVSGDTRLPICHLSSDFIGERKTRKLFFHGFQVLTFQI